MKVSGFSTLLFGLVILLASAGCGDGSVGNTNQKPPTEAEIEQQIKEIEADPNMPDQAKAIRINMLRQNGGRQGGSAAPEGPKAGG